MKKSQALIFQFVLFFIIGFSLFLMIGNLFRFHSDIIRGDVADLELKLANSYISSIVITSVDSCKGCDEVNMKFTLKDITGTYPIIDFKNGLNVSIIDKYHFSSLNNLNETLDLEESKVS